MSEVFKAYDIRGIYPLEINEELAERIGYATAQFLSARRLIVGRDMRRSSKPLADAVKRGIVKAGTYVIDVGLVSTDALYFAVGHERADGGIMVTASHNPPRYNGFKICREQAIPLSEKTGLGDIHAIVYGHGIEEAKDHGTITDRDITEAYKKHVLRFADDLIRRQSASETEPEEPRRLKVVLDASNGMAGKMFPPVLEELKPEFVRLYFELDGTFPNHGANPLIPENLEDLCERVKAEGADFGAAFDGDADRCVFVDEKGEIVPCDLVTAVIAEEVLKREPGAAIVYDLRSSKAVPERIRELGGVPVRERVGHSFIKKTMRDRNAPFGGEVSGHYYFRDNFYADSGIIALIKMLNILAHSKQRFSELVVPLRRYYSTGEVNFEVDDPDQKLQQIEETFSNEPIDHLDGVSIDLGDWWFNVRKSNTEPILRLTLEAKTSELRDEGLKRVSDIIKS